MKIAVTHENGNVFGHFGHTEEFKIYTITDGKLQSSEVVPTNGQGHGSLAGFLRDQAVDALICGGIGGGAKQALASVNIALYPGVAGSADAAVEAFLAETLNYNPNTQCSHHGEGHEHGEHKCGGHGHGDHHHHGEGHQCHCHDHK